MPLLEDQRPGFWLIADDVLGGFFALDGGALGAGSGNVSYFAPDSLRWEPLGMSYSQFVQWALGAELAGFYKNLRWPEWKSDMHLVNGDQAYSIYPPLWTQQGKDIGHCSRKPCPVAEILALTVGTLPGKSVTRRS